jgi:hypothetical protein
MNALRTFAEAFRAAIEATPPELRPPCLQRFPYGACSDASLLLARYLGEHGYPECRLVSAERGTRADNSWSTHAWLTCNGQIVDITADQFTDAPDAVIINHASSWHEGFEVTQVDSARLESRSGPPIEALERFYPTLLQAVRI